ncbi:phage holin family protein [Ornithinimicrobium sediminis]|uniref:phage holin family protein n=1 Tax=Ornithinimicrobium sediminis TaxID=2904603 RepID=UPI001E60765C|nr:phage holin family protein [Ornithinimicrobium sediminis]MCE0485852.1 phage holin family protein [Ornithinimicrobium sediminis]
MATSAESTDAPPSPPQGVVPERTIGQLVADASADMSAIVRSEIELAKVEITQDVTHAGKGIGMFVGAAALSAYGFGLLLLAAAWGLAAAGLPLWAGLLIVAVALFLVAGILALVGKKQVGKVQGKPVKAIDNAQKTVAVVKPPARKPDQPAPAGVGPAVATSGATAATESRHA